MSWKIRQKLRELLKNETNLCHATGRGGSISICLVYPNRYYTAMSSLGFQTVYRLLVQTAGVNCERGFLPEKEDLQRYMQIGEPLMSLESQRPLTDFDVVAFSTSFEPDYLNIPLILELAGIPTLSSERNQSHPLVIAGGAAFFINPEPVADFIDLICIGEAEALLPSLLNALTSSIKQSRSELLNTIASFQGFYLPSHHIPLYENTHFIGYETKTGVETTVNRLCAPESSSPSTTAILTDDTEFGGMFLIEVSRGCPRGCRFCSSGFIYAPFRFHPIEKLLPLIDEGLQYRNKIGLVGAAVSDHPDFHKLCGYVVERGGKVSVSSLRMDRIKAEALLALKSSGHKTISLAPEGGSQRMRDMVKKNLTESQILETCELIINHDILNLRLYFIIGLPSESMADLEELVKLVIKIRERVVEKARLNGRLGEIVISVNPFIPKPFTPLQWCGMEPLASLEKKVKFLESTFRPLANVRLKVENLKECYFQALLSRGDRRLGKLLISMNQGMNLKKSARLNHIETEEIVTGTLPVNAAMPWDIIASSSRELLLNEYKKSGSPDKEQ